MVLTVLELAVILILPQPFVYSRYYKRFSHVLFLVILYQLIPRFWLGQTNGGFVRTLYTSEAKEFIIVAAPYVRDLLLSVLCSLFDVFNNYLAYVLGALNDFNALGVVTSPFVPHILGISIILSIACVFFISFPRIIKIHFGRHRLYDLNISPINGINYKFVLF